MNTLAKGCFGLLTMAFGAAVPVRAGPCSGGSMR